MKLSFVGVIGKHVDLISISNQCAVNICLIRLIVLKILTPTFVLECVSQCLSPLKVSNCTLLLVCSLHNIPPLPTPSPIRAASVSNGVHHAPLFRLNTWQRRTVNSSCTVGIHGCELQLMYDPQAVLADKNMWSVSWEPSAWWRSFINEPNWHLMAVS